VTFIQLFIRYNMSFPHRASPPQSSYGYYYVFQRKCRLGEDPSEPINTGTVTGRTTYISARAHISSKTPRTLVEYPDPFVPLSIISTNPSVKAPCITHLKGYSVLSFPPGNRCRCCAPSKSRRLKQVLHRLFAKKKLGLTVFLLLGIEEQTGNGIERERCREEISKYGQERFLSNN